jgi:tetratricopeptide (TPR) repeat protein
MNWYLFILLVLLGLGSYVGYFLLFRRQIMKLTALLYQDNNPDGFLAELDSIMSKLFFPKKMHAMMKIDAYLMKGDKEKLKELFASIKNYKIRPGDEFYVEQKEVAFYVELQDVDNATAAYNRMIEIYDTFKDKTNYEGVMKETEYTYEINLRHSGKYANEMIDLAKAATSDFSSGIYYYRAAKCYYYKKENRLMKEALLKAQQKLKGTFYDQLITDILEKDVTLIETK